MIPFSGWILVTTWAVANSQRQLFEITGCRPSPGHPCPVAPVALFQASHDDKQNTESLGTWQSYGPNTCCRLHGTDASNNGNKTTTIKNTASLINCKTACMEEPWCQAIEYGEKDHRCELWPWIPLQGNATDTCWGKGFECLTFQRNSTWNNPVIRLLLIVAGVCVLLCCCCNIMLCSLATLNNDKNATPTWLIWLDRCCGISRTHRSFKRYYFSCTFPKEAGTGEPHWTFKSNETRITGWCSSCCFPAPTKGPNESGYTQVPAFPNKLKVLIFGEAGVGKSTLINDLTGADASVGTSVEGVTKECQSYEAEVHTGTEIELVDCPGLGDNDVHIPQVVDQLRHVNPQGEWAAVIFVLKAQTLRYDVGTRLVTNFLTGLFSEVGQSVLLKKMIVVATHADLVADANIVATKQNLESLGQKVSQSIMGNSSLPENDSPCLILLKDTDRLCEIVHAIEEAGQLEPPLKSKLLNDEQLYEVFSGAQEILTGKTGQDMKKQWKKEWEEGEQPRRKAKLLSELEDAQNKGNLPLLETWLVTVENADIHGGDFHEKVKAYRKKADEWRLEIDSVHRELESMFQSGNFKRLNEFNSKAAEHAYIGNNESIRGLLDKANLHKLHDKLVPGTYKGTVGLGPWDSRIEFTMLIHEDHSFNYSHIHNMPGELGPVSARHIEEEAYPEGNRFVAKNAKFVIDSGSRFHTGLAEIRHRGGPHGGGPCSFEVGCDINVTSTASFSTDFKIHWGQFKREFNIVMQRK